MKTSVAGCAVLAWTILLAAVAAHRERRGARGVAHPAQTPLLAMQAILALSVAGGPLSAVSFLMLAGWIGLTFARMEPAESEAAEDAQSSGTIVSSLRAALRS